MRVLGNSDLKGPALLVMGFLVAHLANINLPMVNLEYAFVDATEYFRSHDQKLINNYFDVQANPVTLAYMSSLLSIVFPDASILVLIRGLSISSVLLLGIGILNICRYVGRQDHTIILALVLFNPLFWVFSARATADFAPVSIGIFAISLVLGKNHRLIRALAAGVLLGLATMMKYPSLCLSVVLMALLWVEKDRRAAVITFATVVTIAVVMLGAYLIAAHESFGFWVTPIHFQEIFQEAGTLNPIENFVVYAGYLTLMCGFLPIANTAIWAYVKAHALLVVSFAMVIFTVGFLTVQTGGELKLGPLDAWLNTEAMNGVFCVIGIGVYVPILLAVGRKEDRSRVMIGLAFAIIAILFVFSFTRPIQRYLMFVIPFLLIALPTSVYEVRLVTRGAIGLFIIADTFLGYSQWNTGHAAEVMLVEIRQAGLEHVTDVGPMWSHVGFPVQWTARRYHVVLGENARAIAVSESGVSYFKRTYSLVPVDSGRIRQLP